MELEVWPNTASCVPMELCSTRTTSSVTGGSTLIALLLKISGVSMMRLLLKEMLLPEFLTKLSMEHQQNTEQLLTPTLLVTMTMEMLVLVDMRMPEELQGSLEQTEAVGEEDVKDAEETDVEEPDFGFLVPPPEDRV